jgi:IS30 family transposase
MNKRNYSRLTIGERRTIQQGLKERKSINSITKELGRGNSTVVREILRNSFFKQTGGYGSVFNDCLQREYCIKTHLCSKEECRRKYCCGCRFCFHVCKSYEKEQCPGLKRPPYVCDGCRNLRRCTLEKAFYRAEKAQDSADEVMSNTRKGIDLTEAERLRLDTIISPLIRKGQSPYHICVSNKDRIMLSDKTVYKYIAAGLFSAKSTDLRRKVKMKPRKTKPQPKIEKSCREGRTYRDFLDYIERYPDREIVQMDTVIGSKGRGNKVLLTICFPKSEVMLAYIRDANTAKSVTDIFERIKLDIGYNRFEEIFPLILTDYTEKNTMPKNPIVTENRTLISE